MPQWVRDFVTYSLSIITKLVWQRVVVKTN
jgi:hypothetical protein